MTPLVIEVLVATVCATLVNPSWVWYLIRIWGFKKINETIFVLKFIFGISNLFFFAVTLKIYLRDNNFTLCFWQRSQ